MPWRPAQPADLDALHALRRAFCTHLHQAFVDVDDRALLDALLRDDALGRVWALDLNGTLQGYAAVCFCYSLEFRGKYAFLDELYVAEPHRSQGHGRAALDLIADDARARGFAAVRLEVDEWNTRAGEAYKRAAFTDPGRRLLTRWVREARRS